MQATSLICTQFKMYNKIKLKDKRFIFLQPVPFINPQSTNSLAAQDVLLLDVLFVHALAYCEVSVLYLIPRSKSK